MFDGTDEMECGINENFKNAMAVSAFWNTYLVVSYANLSLYLQLLY